MLEPMVLKIFLKVAHHLSFAAAAQELGLSPSQISKSIAALEQQLQKKLFLRTTRQVRLTTDGEMFVPSARRAVETLRETEDFFREEQQDGELSGKIRVTCSHTLGIRRLATMVAGFHARYPRVQIETVLSDQIEDLLAEGIDLAVRIMPLHDSSLMARKLAENPVIFCASPDYLARHPRIRTVADLKKHPLLYIPTHAKLRFSRSKQTLSQVGAPSPLAAGSGDFLVELAIAGAGVLVRSDWGVEREIQQGVLKKITLDAALIAPAAIYAVFDANRFMPKRLRVWIDYLATEFAALTKGQLTKNNSAI